MSLRSGMNAPAVLIDKYINTAYDEVKKVGDNLADINTIAAYINDPETSDDLSLVADAINGAVQEATDAAASATASASSATIAAATATSMLDEFNGIYFGSFPNVEALDIYLAAESLTKDPGDLYFNSTVSTMYVWSGSTWTSVGSYGVYKQTQTAVANQQTFGLNGGLQYVLGANNIQVYVNGLLQLKSPNDAPNTKDYDEASSTSIFFNTGLAAGSVVIFVIGDFVSTTQLGVSTTTQIIAATEAQTVVTVNQYTMGIGNINVYVNGVYQPIGQAVLETSPTVITFTYALTAGDQIVIRKGDIIANATLNIKADTTRLTSTEGQTKFVSTAGYIPNQNNVQVYVNGSKQAVGLNYAENANLTDIDFFTGLNASDVVEIVVGNLTSTAVITQDSALIEYVPSGAGAVSTFVQTKLRESVSVKDFGAVGDGVADDTIAIQAAMDAFPIVGGILFFPKGDYKVTAPLILPDRSADRLVPLIIQGESAITAGEQVGSRLNYTGTTGSLFEGRDASGAGVRRGMIALKDIQLYGQYIPATGSTNTSVGINLYMPTGLRMDNVLVSGFKYGLRVVDYSYYSNIDRCRFARCDYGIYFDVSLTNGLTIAHTQFSTFDSNCAYLKAIGESINFYGCWFENATLDQVNISSSSRHVVFRDCYFEYSGSGYAVWHSRESGTGLNVLLQIAGCVVTCKGTADAVFRIENAATSVQFDCLIEGLYAEILTTASHTSLVRTASGGDLTRVVAFGDITYLETAAHKTLALTSSQPGVIYGYDKAGRSGTFVPLVYGLVTFGAGTYTTQTGRYTRIGDRVFFDLAVVWTAHTGTGNMRIRGLPFTNGSLNAVLQIAAADLTTPVGTIPVALMVANSADMGLYSTPTGGGALAGLTMDTAGTVYVSGSYSV